MSTELGAVVASLPTDSALIRLLPGVGPLVDNETGALVEAFPTFPAAIEALWLPLSPLCASLGAQRAWSPH